MTIRPVVFQGLLARHCGGPRFEGGKAFPPTLLNMILEQLFMNGVIFIASALHGAFGFAFVLVAMPLLSLREDIKLTVPLTSLLFVLLSAIRSVQLKKEHDYKKMIPLLIGAVFGIPLGIFLISVVSERTMKTILGILIIAYSAQSLLVRNMSFRPPDWSAYLFGFLSGTMGGAFNMTGPPVVFYACSQDWKKMTIFGAMNFYFLITSIVVIAFHALAGNITHEVLRSFLYCLPALFAGMFLGNRIFVRVSEETYRNGLYIFLIVAGSILLK